MSKKTLVSKLSLVEAAELIGASGHLVTYIVQGEMGIGKSALLANSACTSLGIRRMYVIQFWKLDLSILCSARITNRHKLTAFCGIAMLSGARIISAPPAKSLLTL